MTRATFARQSLPQRLRSRHLAVLPLRHLREIVVAGCLLSLIGLSGAWAATCTQRYQVTGTVPNEAFGSAVATIGDVDGDGFPDFAVGAPGMPGTPTSPGPAVYVFSGRDGSPVYAQPGPISSEFGAAIAALGDIDGDGVPDYLVGAPESVGPGGGCIFTLSGTYGSGVYTVVNPGPPGTRFGAAVAGGPDLDGDGIADFAVGAPGADTLAGPGSGAVFVYSGRDGHLLYRRDGQAAGDQFGASIAFLRVGINPGPTQAPVLLVGAPGADVVVLAGTIDNAGAAYEFAATTGMLIRKLEGEAADDHFGASVAGLGDVDGDGFNDLVVGAPRAGTGPVRSGAVYVYSGENGSEIFVHHSAIQGDAFGAAVGGSGDVTGDTVSDILVGAPGDPNSTSALPGSVTVLSEGNGLELCRISGQDPGEGFGIAFDSLDDLNGDGFPEWIAGAPGFSVGPLAPIGAVRIYGVVPGSPPGHPPFIEIDSSNPFPFTINLRWGSVPASCAGVDYAVYMGKYARTGQGLTTHLPDTCSTGGATDISLPEPANFPPGTALYFIVTVETSDEEGSYGQGTLGNQHPQSRRPCQVFLNKSSCSHP